MNKKGFTLAELLVALLVIGIIAAVTMPALTNMLPDSNKMQILKIHKVIADINEELLNNKSLYIKEVIGGEVCIGFECTQRPLSMENTQDNNAKYSGIQKYGYLLSDSLQLDGEVTFEDDTVSFTTIDGNEWELTVDNENNQHIVINLGGDDKGDNCVYGANNCSTPDTFSFNVSPVGKISGADSLTSAYLMNPDKFNDRGKDFAKAKELAKSKK